MNDFEDAKHSDGDVDPDILDKYSFTNDEEAIKGLLKQHESLEWKETISSILENKIIHATLFKLADTIKPNKLIKEKLLQAWRRKQKVDSTDPSSMDLTPLQQELLAPLFNHADVYDFSSKWTEEVEYQSLYCLHILNKIQNHRKLILRNNERLVASPELEVRDQGFTRPGVLILVPFRNIALSIISIISSLWTNLGGQVDNQRRLHEELGPSEDDQESKAKRRLTCNQPADFAHNFRDNIDDCFRIGIKCTRKALKLFCDFYSSDIIIASPLGLRMVIDGQSETKKIIIPGTRKTKKKRIVKKGDYDFLSSIQTLIIDRAQIISMQNWDHLIHVLSFINRLPKNSHGCDFSRVRNIFLDGLAANTRQNIVFSEFVSPELNSLIRSFKNMHGKWKMLTLNYPGVLKSLGVTPKFHIVESSNISSLPAARFKFFTEQILPQYSHSTSRYVIFIPSYLDFVQLREYFQQSDIGHLILSEYCTPSEISTARAKFAASQARFLLVTERFHFFKRYRIKGVEQLIFYALPEHAEYFSEWCGFIQPGSGETKVSIPVLVSPYDYLRIERIIGTKRIQQLFNQDKVNK